MSSLRTIFFVVGAMAFAPAIYADSLDCPRTVYTHDEAKTITALTDSMPDVTTGLASPTDVYCIVGKRGSRQVAEKGVLYGKLPYRFEYAYFSAAAFGNAAGKEFSESDEDLSVICSKALEKCTIYPVAGTQAYNFEIEIKNGDIVAVMNFYALQFMLDSGMEPGSGDNVDETKPLTFTLVKDKKFSALPWPVTDTLVYGPASRWEGKVSKDILGVIKNKTVFQLSFVSEQGKTYGFQTDRAHSLASLEVAIAWLKSMAQEKIK